MFYNSNRQLGDNEKQSPIRFEEGYYGDAPYTVIYPLDRGKSQNI
jgi:hypothetical protein